MHSPVLSDANFTYLTRFTPLRQEDLDMGSQLNIKKTVASLTFTILYLSHH